MKLMVMPVGRSLVFSGSQAKNISYPTDHRRKIFRTLPQMAWGGEFFSSDIMWWLGDWTRLIPSSGDLAAERQRQIAEAKQALLQFTVAAEALVQKLQPLAPVAIETGACGANVQLLSRQLAIDVEVGLREASSYVERVLAGGEPIRSEPTPIEPPPPPPPPPPAIERRSVFLRYAGRWLEGDETKTSGAHTIVGLPVEVARAALEFNHAVPVDSQAAADLRAIMDPGYGVWPDRSVHRSNQAQAAAKAAGRTSNGRRVARA